MPVTIGTPGRTVTPLRPTGFVEIAGVRYDAKLESTPTADAGVEVVVAGGNAFGLIVRVAAEVADPAALPGFGTTATPPDDRPPKTLREALWEHRLRLALLLVLMAVFPVVGGLIYGIEGVAVGLVIGVFGVPAALVYWGDPWIW